MSELTPAIEPDLSDPAPLGPLAGNHADDDGQALDDYFEAPSHGPLSYDDLIVPQVDNIAPTNRILSRNLNMTVGDDPVLILPKDVNRLSLNLYFNCNGSNGSNNVLRFASEKSLVYDGAMVYPVWNSNALASGRSYVINLDKYTGALWVWPDPVLSIAAVVFSISVWGVTS